MQNKQVQKLTQHPLENKILYDQINHFCYFRHDIKSVSNIQKIFDDNKLSIDQQRYCLAFLFFNNAFVYHFKNKQDAYFLTLENSTNKIVRKNFNKFNRNTDLIIPRELNIIFFNLAKKRIRGSLEAQDYPSAILLSILKYINMDNIHQLDTYKEHLLKKEKRDILYEACSLFLHNPHDNYQHDTIRKAFTKDDIQYIFWMIRWAQQYKTCATLDSQCKNYSKVIHKSGYPLYSYIAKDIEQEI